MILMDVAVHGINRLGVISFLYAGANLAVGPN